MSLLDPQPSRNGFVDKLTLKSTFLWSIAAFGFLTLVGPYLAFRAFTAKDESGVITLILGLIFLLWLCSGF